MGEILTRDKAFEQALSICAHDGMSEWDKADLQAWFARGWFARDPEIATLRERLGELSNIAENAIRDRSIRVWPRDSRLDRIDAIRKEVFGE